MALQVTLTKAPDSLSDFGTPQTVHIFGAGGGTLGRSASNTWSLPDPDRFLSSCHCEIVFADDQFHIVDLSTNGTFVNGSPEPLGKGVKAPLRDGDTFEIGDYQFSVTVASADAGPGSSPFPSPAPEPLFADDVNPSGGNPFSDPFAPSAPIVDDFSLTPDTENTDPLIALDRAGAQASNEASTKELFSGYREPASDPFAGLGSVDPSPGMDEAVAWPDSSPQNLIPDDWEDDLLGPVADRTEPPPSAPLSTPAPRPTPRPTPGHRAVEAAPETEPVQRPQPVAEPATPPTSVTAGRSEHSFVRALGLDPEALSEEQVAAISETAGQLMREVVEGMMQLLRSRTSIKNEFRMNVTTIEPFENNPLKFSVGVDEALENMFVKKSKAYKEPMAAFRESFQEIGEHQLAMIAGIRVGFEKMMARFDPELLEQLFGRQSKNSAIPGIQRARNWTHYCNYYEGFSDNMESSFQSLFGSDFVQAYEDQLRRLGASRKQ